MIAAWSKENAGGEETESGESWEWGGEGKWGKGRGNQGSSDTWLNRTCTSISLVVWILVSLCYIIHYV